MPTCVSLHRVDTCGEKVRPDCRGWGVRQSWPPPCDALLLMRVGIPLFPLGWHLLIKGSLKDREVCRFRELFLPKSTRHWAPSPSLPHWSICPCVHTLARSARSDHSFIHSLVSGQQRPLWRGASSAVGACSLLASFPTQPPDHQPSTWCGGDVNHTPVTHARTSSVALTALHDLSPRNSLEICCLLSRSHYLSSKTPG